MFAEFEGWKSRRPGVAIALGTVLRERRELLGLPQKAIASRASIGESYVRLLERGARQPTVAVFLNLAQALELAPAALLETLVQRLKQDPAALRNP